MSTTLRKHSLHCRINGQEREFEITSAAQLLHVLRNDAHLNGPRLGCGLGQCGACTVWVDGHAARSCCIPALEMQGRDITTLEGLAKVGMQAVPQAFIDAQAAQCGYCLNGMIMMAARLLRDQPEAGDDAIVRSLSGNLCRCGTHVEILAAVRLAARRMKESA